MIAVAERPPFTLAWLETEYGYVKWRQPIAVTTPKGEGFDCRVCVASFGKKASDGPQFPTRKEARDHIRTAHEEETT